MMRRLVGLGLIAGSAVAYSLAGFFTRLIPLDVMTLLFWRGIFAGGMIAALVVLQHRRGAWAATRAVGVGGLIVAALSTLASYLFLAAFRHTTVADVAVIYATLPLLASGLAWLLLREREGWRAMVASLAALAGVALMAGGAVGAGRLVGDLLAFGMTLTFALAMVLIRRGRAVSMLPAVAVSCFLTSLLAWPFAQVSGIPGHMMVQLGLFGVTQLGFGLVLLTLGMRRVSAAQAALVGLLDTPLAPIWVWLAFDEAPPALTLLGGGIIMAAVAWNMVGATRHAVEASA